MTIRVLIILVVTYCLSFGEKSFAITDIDSTPVYTFGIVPQQSAQDLVRSWGPLLHYLSNETGLRLKFSTAPSIPEFEKRLSRGEYDLAYMNPYHYVVFHQRPGYIAFAHQENKKLTGLIVTRIDSDLNTLEDLEGLEIAFPAPAAFAATLIPRGVLNNKGINYTANFVRSHDSVYRSIAQGFIKAGGGIERTLSSIEPEIRDQLRVIWHSEGFQPHPFAAHPRIPDSTVNKIENALVNLKKSSNGRALLAKISFSGIVGAKDSDWDSVRKIDFRKLTIDNKDTE